MPAKKNAEMVLIEDLKNLLKSIKKYPKIQEEKIQEITFNFAKYKIYKIFLRISSL